MNVDWISSTAGHGNTESPPILCVSDLHGNLALLRKALTEGLARAGRDDLQVVLLGDYVDNGTEVWELLEYLSTEQWRQEFPCIELLCIAGNHDVALLLAHSPSEFQNDPLFRRRGQDWWHRWSQLFCIRGGETAWQYSAKTHEEFVQNFPQHHFEFLRDLPWVLELEQYIFVHAGLRLAGEEVVEEQLRFLYSKDISDLSRHVYARGGYGLPDQLSNKNWAKLNDPEWGRVVVTGHNKYSHRSDAADFVASHRIGFHACACQILFKPGLPLHCALLPRAPPGTTTSEARPDFFSVSHCETYQNGGGEKSKEVVDALAGEECFEGLTTLFA
mmetsp:Transcript_37295/g.69473  ORF Transcript_37295/g.69473 Transcript_37295/m.69473 type:complete len:331 (-) Transcript_37295:4043-5035(-)